MQSAAGFITEDARSRQAGMSMLDTAERLGDRELPTVFTASEGERSLYFRGPDKRIAHHIPSKSFRSSWPGEGTLFLDVRPPVQSYLWWTVQVLKRWEPALFSLCQYSAAIFPCCFIVLLKSIYEIIKILWGITESYTPTAGGSRSAAPANEPNTELKTKRIVYENNVIFYQASETVHL